MNNAYNFSAAYSAFAYTLLISLFMFIKSILLCICLPNFVCLSKLYVSFQTLCIFLNIVLFDVFEIVSILYRIPQIAERVA